MNTNQKGSRTYLAIFDNRAVFPASDRFSTEEAAMVELKKRGGNLYEVRNDGKDEECKIVRTVEKE